MGESSSSLPITDAQQAVESQAVPPEIKQTSHRVLEKLDPERRGLHILHRDLFDSNQAVVLSALSAIGALKERRSLQFVLRLAAQDDEPIQCAALQALAAMGHADVAGFLVDLYKLSRNDTVRRAALEAIGMLPIDDEAVAALLRQQAVSHLVAREIRSAAAKALVRLGGGAAAADLLRTADPTLVEAVYSSAQGDPSVAAVAIEDGIRGWQALDATSRISLMRMAAPFRPASLRMLIDALDDPSQDVRQAAYAAIGTPGQGPCAAAIVEALASRTDPSPVLEDDALSAIERLEAVLAAEPAATAGRREPVDSQVREIFGVLRSERQVTNDSHELGWMIARSREYLEYYADDDFRQSVVGYLKGSSNYNADALLDALKRSAVRVEVRHFDGYTCLADLLKNPRRSGLGLIAREFAIARLGRRPVFYRLIRCLRLTRLFRGEVAGAAALYGEIFAWSRKARMYRLAEAALYALEHVDKGAAIAGCVECLTIPLTSKICAIASVRLMRNLDSGPFEASVAALLGGCADPHVLLNLVDALAGSAVPATAQTTEAVLSLFIKGTHQETLQAVARFLARQSSLDLLQGIANCYEPAPGWKRALALDILERWIVEDRIPGRDVLLELLYRLLRLETAGPNRARAAVLLVRLGDDYPMKILAEAARERRIDECVQAARSLKGALTVPMSGLLRLLLSIDHATLQAALAETLVSVGDEQPAGRIRDLVLSLRGVAGLEPDEPAAAPQVDLLNERRSYRFEREYIREMAVVFSDIQGYSKKAQALSTIDIAALIQEYEGILLPTMSSHRGELIKKMGDGHLFVFPSALDAVLAGIRLQKALKRFNYYRDEVRRVVVRVGIDWGKIIRKEGDVLGNHVNIASRLESAATGGSVFVSEAVHERLGGHIHSREVGPITVKGISGPIRVYEPYETAIDLPKDLDPLTASDNSPPQGEAGAGADTNESAAGVASPADAKETGIKRGPRAVVTLDRKGVQFIAETFSHLNEMCRRAALKEVPVEEISHELARRWRELRNVLATGGNR